MAAPDEFVIGTIVPTALLAKFGLISILFSHLDMEVNRAIWGFLGIDERLGRAVTQRIFNFSMRLQLLATLGRLRDIEERHEQIDAIVKHLGIANDDRNRLTHDEFYRGDPATLEVSVLRFDPELKTQRVYEFDVAVLDDLADRLWKLRRIVFMFRNNHDRWWDEPLPSLDKSPTQRLRRDRQKGQKTDRKRPSRRRSSSP
jgi:hypothetical protein